MRVDILPDVKEAIDSGINYLCAHQHPNGEFCCYIAGDDTIEQWSYPDTTVFPTSLITGCLIDLPQNEQLRQIFERAGSFLMQQMMGYGVWGHYTKRHPFFGICPADADDTALASYALSRLGMPFPENRHLLRYNRSTKGLFYTWFVLRLNKSRNITYWKVLMQEVKNLVKTFVLFMRHECSRGDIDAVVNANVIYYLKDYAQTVDVTTYLSTIILEGRESNCDKWYLNPFIVYYSISRNYPYCEDLLEECRMLIIERILATQQDDGKLGVSSLDTALGISSLMYLRCSDQNAIEKSVLYLLGRQSKNGDWSRRLFYYGGPKRIVGWGSEELTTGFCLEALGLYHKFYASRQ